jgi:23S rRNA (uracil1939-C5)-methyltransferase
MKPFTPAIEDPNDPLELNLTDVVFGGDAIARHDGQVIFVPFGLPGERVQARLLHAKRDYATAELFEVLEAAPGRIEPRCPHFGVCGGCQFQHASYQTQLELKRHVVVDQLHRIGGIANAEELVAPAIGMIDPWGYRNHVRFTLGRKYGDVGYTYRQSHRLLPIDLCAIAHPAINEVLARVQRRCAGLKAHQIAVRYGANTGDLLITPKLPMVSEVESGQAGLTEAVLDRVFFVSPAAFFQVNTRREARDVPASIGQRFAPERSGPFSIADILALLVLDRLEPQPDDLVVDAYCGVGTFSTLIAPHVRTVIGIEESSAAVKNAERNAEDLSNTRFIAAKTEHILAELDAGTVDGLVIDPARVGCAPPVTQAMLDRHPRRVVYVSCDPATLARDLRFLQDGGYHIDGVEPLDMFPQTGHIETVTTLTWPG